MHELFKEGVEWNFRVEEGKGRSVAGWATHVGPSAKGGYGANCSKIKNFNTVTTEHSTKRRALWAPGPVWLLHTSNSQSLPWPQVDRRVKRKGVVYARCFPPAFHPALLSVLIRCDQWAKRCWHLNSCPWGRDLREGSNYTSAGVRVRVEGLLNWPRAESITWELYNVLAVY